MPRMTKAERKARLLATLKDAASKRDTEVAHGDADQALLDYINDPEISKAFDAIKKYYS